MKDTICVSVGADHLYYCTVKTIARTGESLTPQLEITIPEELSDYWAYIDFKKANGETVKTPRLDIVDSVITYNIPLYVINTKGELETQLVLQKESGEIWKSTVKKYYVDKSIDATEDIPDKEDFITEAQKLVDEVNGEQSDKYSNVLKGHTNGGFVTDISPIKHNIVCRVKSKNKMPNKVLDLANWTNTKFNTYYFYSIELEAGKTYCLSGYSSSTTGKYDYLYLMKSNDNFATLSNVIQLFRDSTKNNGRTFVAEEGYKYALYYYGSPENFSQYYDLMIEEGTSITQYAPQLEDLTQSGVAYANDELGTNEQFVYADENGDIEGIVSLFPLMTFRVVYKTSDIATESAVLEIIYNRDINKAFEELKNAIISLGGNV